VGQRLDVPGTYNFREVSTAVAGGPVRPGRLYRSDALSGLTRDGRARLAGLGVRRVVDLRSPFDLRLGGRDRLRGVGAEVVRIPIAAGGSTRDASALSLRGIYREILGEYGRQVGSAIRAIATADGPVVVHCTAGKDRTGLVVALLLLGLGAEYDEVAADYAATAANLTGEWTDAMLRRMARFRVPVTDSLLEVLAGSPEPVLRDSLDWLDTTFGGVPQYLASVGVDDEVVARLRAALLDA
jgi:protein-tyrosine phosphatase